MRSLTNSHAPPHSSFPLRTTRRLSILGLAVGSLAPLSSAQWFGVSIHPASAQSSTGIAGDGGGQAGFTITGGVQHAACWSGLGGQYIDLHPGAATASQAVDNRNNTQVGWATVGGIEVASAWSGVAGSWSNLNPAGALGSRAYGTDLGFQAGFVVDVNGHARGAVWQGSAASFTDLTPSNATDSAVWGMRSIMQAGQATITGQGVHAGTWLGSPGTWTDLHPAGATLSQAYGTDGVQQVGRAIINGSDRGSLWSGSAASWIDLTPNTTSNALVYSVDAGEQVGEAGAFAFFWAGSASSAFNLGAILPPNYASGSSRATSIFHSGGHAYVLGVAQNSLAGNRQEAILWKRLTMTTYCTAKVNSLGCTPSIEGFGTSSATSSNVFQIRSLHMFNHKPGILLYSNTGRAAAAFTGGTLCVNGPLRRVSGLDSGGLGQGNNCNGIFLVDMNAFRAGALGGNPAAYLSVPGTMVNCQFWGRDPGFTAPNGTQLSNALEFEIGP